MSAGYLAIMDWGVGGLGLYKAIKARCNEPVLYFSDSGHTPYGNVPPDQLQTRLSRVFDYLFERGASHIAVACNAASTALPLYQNTSGIIDHGAAMLKSGGWRSVGILAGRRTVLSKVYYQRLKTCSFRLRQRVAQPLSAHVEAGNLTGTDLDNDIKTVVKPIRDADAILLACTHYPAIAGRIKAHVSRHCVLLDPAERMASWIMNNWYDNPANDPAKTPALDPGSDVWLTTGQPAEFRRAGAKAFDVTVGNVEQLNVGLF